MIVSYVPILVFVGTVASQYSACKSLQWVPGNRRQKIFTAILNHVDCPTWSTRNVITKDATEYTRLLLPRDTPFAFLCGACFSPGSLQANLTAEITNGQSLTFVPVQKNRNTKEHTKDENTVCLISYGLTAPLTKGGQIICRLNRGKVHEEKLTFSVKTTSVSDAEEETIEMPSKGVVRLKCPEEDAVLQKRQNVYVWYSVGKEDSPSDDIPFLVPNMNREIDFRPKAEEHHVACAVYDVINPSTVLIKRYRVLSSTAEIQTEHWVEPEAKTSAGISRGIIIVVGLLGGGIFLTSFLVCASFGLCKCGKKTETEPQEPIRSSLLQTDETGQKYVPSPNETFSFRKLEGP